MILLRPSAEIFLKSANVRRKWERKLISEIKRAIGDVRLRKGGGRIWIEENITPEARDRLRYIFGIHSFSVCKRCSLQQLEEQVLSFWDERWGEKSGFSFAVRVKREGQHDFTSQEMAARIGERGSEIGKVLSLEEGVKRISRIFKEIINEFSRR